MDGERARRRTWGRRWIAVGLAVASVAACRSNDEVPGEAGPAAPVPMELAAEVPVEESAGQSAGQSVEAPAETDSRSDGAGLVGWPDPPERQRRRAEIGELVRRSPGWSMAESAHWFGLASTDDVERLDEALEQLEAMLAFVREDFPESLAGDRAPTWSPGTARFLTNRAQYHAYGGPTRSSCYWSGKHRELVAYFVPRSELSADIPDALAPARGAVFLAWFDHLARGGVGHSWFADGLSGYYRACRWDGRAVRPPGGTGAFLRPSELAPASGVPTVRELVERESRVETWSEIGSARALAWFLLHGAEEAATWDPAWDAILPTYAETLVRTLDRDRAREAAWGGVDLDALDAALREELTRERSE